MSLVHGLSRVGRETPTVSDFYAAALELICEATGWSLGHVFQKDPANPTLLVSTDIWWPKDPSRFSALRSVTADVSFDLGQGIPGQVMESAAPLWIEDLEEDCTFVRSQLGQALSVRAALGIPVLGEDEPLAVFELFHDEPSPRNDRLLEHLEDLGLQLGWIADLKAREKEAGILHRRMERVVDAVNAVGSAGMNPDDVMQVTAERAQELTSATSAGVYVSTGQNSDELVMKGASGNAEPYRGSRLTLEDSLSGYALESGEIFVSEDCAEVTRLNQDLVGSTGLRSLVIVPLVDDDGLSVGLLNVMSNQTFAFDEREVSTLQVLSRYMGSALARAWTFRRNEELVEELSLASRSLTEAVERLEATLDASLHPIIALDGAGRVTLWSHAAEELYGWSEEEALGESPPMVPEELEPVFRAQIERVHSGDSFQNVDSYHLRRDGTRVDVRLSATSLLDRKGRTGTLLVATDVTQLRAVEARLLHAERLESIGRLAGGVAHDFNNMLTAIQGHVDLLLTSDLSEDDADSVQEIMTAVRRSTYITKQLLAYSRRQHLEARLVYPSSSIVEMSGLLNRLLGERVDLTLDLDPDAGPVLVDPGQIDQVIMNLVVNARDALPDGGSIAVRTRTVEFGKEETEELGGMEPGSYVCISVRDDGAGIPSELQTRIFEPFFSTRGPEGTGLGLATVDGVVHQSGGALRLESEVGRGSTFYVYLPVAEEEAGADTAGAGWEDEGQPVILLVQEPEVIQRLFRRILEPRGYTVLSTPKRSRSLELMAESETGPDLLVIDAAQGTSSAQEYVDHVRRLRPRLPILFIGDDPYPFGWEDELKNALRIMKPFGPGTLEDAVSQLLAGSSFTPPRPA